MIESNKKKISDLYDEISLLDENNIFYDLDIIRLNAEIGIRTALGKHLNGENLFPWDYKNIYKFNKGIELISEKNYINKLEITCLLNVFSNYSLEEISTLNNLYNDNIEIMNKFNQSKTRHR